MKIIGIGANYMEEINSSNQPPKDLMIFAKPETALTSGGVFHYPDCSELVYYELEVVLKINQTVKAVTSHQASDTFDELCLGIDWTAKDLQKEAKSKGWPWLFAKGFDEAAFLGDWLSVGDFEDVHNVDLELKVNGEPMQQGNTRQMLANYEQIIAYISKFMTLESGDIIMTGTPPTPGPIQRGDRVEGFLNGIKQLDFDIV